MRRDLPKNFAIPNRDVGKIVIAGHAVPVRYIDDAVIAESHARSQTGFAQGERDVVPATKMLINLRRQGDVCQNIAAVSDKWLNSEVTLCILDAAAGFEQVWFVNQRRRASAIAVLAKKVLE